MRTFTYLMGHRTSLRITLLCLFFVSELFYLQFLDMKIPNNGEHAVFIGECIINTCSCKIHRQSRTYLERKITGLTMNIIFIFINLKISHYILFIHHKIL